MSIAEGVAPKSKFDEEKEAGYIALDDYMNMMRASHTERTGRGGGTVSHGTTWCVRQSKEWAVDHSLNPDSHDATSKWPGWGQFMFVRDDILRSLGCTVSTTFYPPWAQYDDQVGASVPDVVVVGSHTSKSVMLPVMQFKWRDILVTCRNNFHDWKVSVEMPLGLDPAGDLLDIAPTKDSLLHPVYFEGFPREYIYPPLDSGEYALTGQFSTLFGSSGIGYHKMWTFFWLLGRWYEERFGPLAT